MENLGFFVSRYKLVYLAVLFFSVVLYLRFTDIRGSFFPNSYDLVEYKGTVIHSKIKAGIKPRYKIDIRYSYVVGGKKYSSTKYGFGFKGSRYEESVSNVVSQYKSGDQITIYYSRTYPGFSVISKESNSRLELLIFLVFWSALIAALITLSKKKGSATSNP